MTPNSISSVAQLPETLRSILQKRGVPGDAPISALKDGGNNQVFRIAGGAHDFVLKRYFQHAADTRDRFNTERNFYELLWQGGVRQIPEPCGWDAETRLGIFPFVAGIKLSPREITRESIAQAIQFTVQINTLRKDIFAANIAAASEAFFSASEQLAAISQRIGLLQQIQAESQYDHQALAFSREKIAPAWLKISASITRSRGGIPALDQPLDIAKRCLSPSDFGFHNALLAKNGRLHFIDFEYAGWDDPAKLVCDFFCQPQVPVSLEFWDWFNQSVSQSLGLGDELPRRTKILLPAFQIKWCCIMLNHFLKSGRARREFAGSMASEETKAAQLAKAARLLASIRDPED